MEGVSSEGVLSGGGFVRAPLIPKETAPRYWRCVETYRSPEELPGFQIKVGRYTVLLQLLIQLQLQTTTTISQLLLQTITTISISTFVLYNK